MQLLHPRAQLGGVLLALDRRLLQQVLDVDGEQHAVDRPARPRLAQQGEEAVPGAGVDRRVRFLRGVAAGGVDQHRLVGEPPVAVARAADAAHAGAAHLLGQREVQAGVDQRRGLARAGRADEDVPGQLDRGMAAPLPLAAAVFFSTSSASPKRWFRVAISLSALLGPLVMPSTRAALARRWLQTRQDQRAGSSRPNRTAMTVMRIQVRIERPRFADRDQRADLPDRGPRRDDAEQRQEQRMQQEAEELAHAADGHVDAGIHVQRPCSCCARRNDEGDLDAAVAGPARGRRARRRPARRRPGLRRACARA